MTTKTRKVWVVPTPRGSTMITYLRSLKRESDEWAKYMNRVDNKTAFNQPGKKYHVVRAELRYPAKGKGKQHG